MTCRFGTQGRARPVALGAVVVMSLLMAAACTEPPAVWTAVPVADPALPGTPNGSAARAVSCGSARTCVAAFSGVVARWSGGAWAAMADQPTDTLGELDCVGDDWCLGLSLGDGQSPATTWVWSGGRWAAAAAPRRLGAVSCATVGVCVAVGADGRLRWNGSDWAFIDYPTYQLPRQYPRDVSCPSATWCVTIGDGDTGTAVVQRWDGTGWADLGVPQDLRGFTSIDCPTSDVCVGINNFMLPTAGGDLRALMWTGGSWRAEVLPGPASAWTGIRSISCASARWCVASGVAGVAGGTVGLAWRWDGVSWAAMTLPDPTTAATVFSACASPSACALAGTDSARGGAPYLATWDGSRWNADRTVAGAPPPSRAQLTDVACRSRSRCVAVGWAVDGDGDRSLTSTWDGVAWALRPAAGTDGVRLESVSCPAEDRCTASGARVRSGSTTAPVLRTGDGTTWRDVDLGRLGLPADANLTRVDCPTAAACVATGAGWTLTGAADGTGWHVAAGPEQISANLRDLSCADATTCVGVDGGIWSWDGQRWSLAPQTEPGGPLASAVAVSCTTTGPCTVLTHAGPLIRSTRDGTWAAMPVGDNVYPDELTRLSCESPQRCVATGYFSGSAGFQAMSAVWDGASWSAGPAPTIAAIEDPTAGGVSCVDRWCMRVGALAGPLPPDRPRTLRPAAEIYGTPPAPPAT